MMIFLHLFNSLQNIELCHPTIFVHDIPLVFILSKACNPVPFFLLLGGYGLYIVWQKGDKNRWGRIIKLYIHWCIILILFVTLGSFLKPQKYPGSFIQVVENIIGYNTSYNDTVWFLLPYIILSILAPIIFKYFFKLKAFYIISITLFIHVGTSFCISRYGSSYLFFHHFEYNLLLPFHLLFNFCLGALCAKYYFFEKLKAEIHKFTHKTSLIGWGGVIIIFSISCIFKYNYFYAFIFISFFSLIRLLNPVKTILIKLGDNSMNMWLIHAWYCYYLFKTFIYSFSNPFLIFIVLILISYGTSIAINYISLPIERLVLSKFQIHQKPIL